MFGREEGVFSSSAHMWKFNPVHLRQFSTSLQRLPRARLLAAFFLFLLALLYPGHNSLQSRVLNPGRVLSFDLALELDSLYPKWDGTPPPALSARAVIVQDLGSKTLLYSRNPDTLILPASTTKIMTALVALETWPDLNTVITVKNEDRAIGQTINLLRQEELTLESLLYGLLVHSGNDAALALADNFPGGYPKFVEAMNAKAQDLHLTHTIYKNPSGVEQYGHVTTARDLAVLAGAAIKNPVLTEIVGTRSKLITDVTGQIPHQLTSTNELLGVLPGLKGLKTGWTQHAGECLVSVVERSGHTVVIVVMGSLDRFGETTALAEWSFAHHNWIIPEL